jgi:1,4-dihydroxy-2-naphthoate octaprenyltransferase
MNGPSQIAAFWLASRPKTLAAALVPVSVGSAVAHVSGGFTLGPALAALSGALALQVAANLANDVADFERGADAPDRLGPARAAQSGLLSPEALKRGALGALVLALAAGVYLASLRGWAIVALGGLSMIAAVAYTAGPWPLAYHGLGELFVLVFFGFVAVAGTTFAVTGHVPAVAWPAALSVGALATALLVVNNLRDRQSDARVGKRTLAVRLGERFTCVEYGGCLFAAYSAAAWVAFELGGRALLPLMSLPLGLRLIRAVSSQRGAALNRVLEGTARLLLVFGALLAVGIALTEVT